MSMLASWAKASTANDAAVTIAPTVSNGLDPNRASSRPANDPASSIITVEGTMKRPAEVTDAPKPNPVDLGSSTSWGMRMNELYIPAPSRKATRFVRHTAGSCITRMSTSGSRLRSSTHTQIASTTKPKAVRPIVRAEPQPQLGASLIASSTAARPAESRAAASQLMRLGALIGDSGTNRAVATAATTTATSGTQNSQW